MRAARFHGREDIRVEEVEEEKCGPDQIRVATAYVGICGSDLHEYLCGPNYCPSQPHPLTNQSIPMTLGHEFSGIIKEVGSSTIPFSVGQRVVVHPSLSCGKCPSCAAGVENLCRNGGFIGYARGGGLSDSVIVPSSAVLKLPDSIPLHVGALVEPLSVAWHAVSMAPLNPSSTVLILGGGPIGLAIIQCLVSLKTKNIIVSEIASARQRFAREFGAHHVLDPTKDDIVAMSRELSGPESSGPDVVFDCAGVQASLKTACQAVKFRGTLVAVAMWEKEVLFQPNWLTVKEARYTSSLAHQRRDFEAVLERLANGSMKPENMITSTIKLENVVEGGFKPLINDKDNQVKILIEVGGGR